MAKGLQHCRKCQHSLKSSRYKTARRIPRASQVLTPVSLLSPWSLWHLCFVWGTGFFAAMLRMDHPKVVVFCPRLFSLYYSTFDRLLLGLKTLAVKTLTFCHPIILISSSSSFSFHFEITTASSRAKSWPCDFIKSRIIRNGCICCTPAWPAHPLDTPTLISADTQD